MKELTLQEIEDMSIQAGLACDGTDFDTQAIIAFARMVESRYNVQFKQMQRTIFDLHELLDHQ